MNNEAELIEKIRANDSELYRELVDRYQAGLIIHCEAMVDDRAQAEDIAQDAFVKAYFELDRFDATKARFSTWLYRIATNMALDHLRRNRRKVNLDDIESRAQLTTPNYMEEDEKRQVRAAVLKLEPPQYSEVIRAYYWDGKSYETIAKQYKTTTGTIGTWIRRAKLELKEKLLCEN